MQHNILVEMTNYTIESLTFRQIEALFVKSQSFWQYWYCGKMLQFEKLKKNRIKNNLKIDVLETMAIVFYFLTFDVLLRCELFFFNSKNIMLH